MERIVFIFIITVCVCVILVYDYINKLLRQDIKELEEENDALTNDPIRLQNEQLRSDLELSQNLAKTFEQAYDNLNRNDIIKITIQPS